MIIYTIYYEYKTMLNFLFTQAGGKDIEYELDKDIIVRSREFFISSIDEDTYIYLLTKIDELKHGDRSNTRSGGIVVKLYRPGEKIIFPNELIRYEEYEQDGIIIHNCVRRVSDVISKLNLKDKYILICLDMIWCRDTVMSTMYEVTDNRRV